MKKKRVKSSNSGQALIIASLVITMLLLSTAYYVFEVKRNTVTDETAEDPALAATKLATVNTVISALVNVSNGGDKSILVTDLNELSLTVRNHSYDGKRDLLFTPSNLPPYQNGAWISWESNGTGISGACVSFLINFSSPSTTYSSQYETNVTTALTIEGVYTGNDTEKSVKVTCRVFNENEPASVNDFTMFYQNETGGLWFKVDLSNNPQMINYGNGTYAMSFNAYAQNALQVSAQAHDTRDVFVIANTTCTGV
jgi:hypothetical protein